MASVPSKTYNLLAVGSPLLCIAPEESELARLVEEHGCGKCFTKEKVIEMSHFVRELKANHNLWKSYSDSSLKASLSIPIEMRNSMYRSLIKRLMDVVVVSVALLVIWPLLLLITLWLHFANKGAGAFFFQARPGKNGKIFKVIKFKTMTDERDTKGNLLPDEKRLTKVGQFIRSPLLMNYLN